MNAIRNILLIVVIVLPSYLSAQEKVLLEYFFKEDCSECKEVSQLIFPELSDTLSGQYTIQKYDLADEKNFLILLDYLNALDDQSNEKVYIILNKKIVLGGLKNIRSNLIDEVRRLYHEKSSPNTIIKDDSRTKERVKLGAVIIAGFLDGINPCVFATLIFFMSLLISAKVTRRKLLLIGILYTSACFMTYFMIGVGFFKILKLSFSFTYLRIIFNSMVMLLLIIFSFLSFRDAIRFKKSEKPDDVTLQLPKSLKNRVHTLMRKTKNTAFLASGIFLLGVIVTLLETVCTGQVYVPTLMLLIEKEGIVSNWLLYLLIYNIMFIIPLIIIFLLTYSGITLISLLNLGRKQLVISKILLGILFLFLAILLALFEFR